ncbi:unnamed protein product [Staurois parvus]|uniref:Uncharacterized protein n=1 Tax=Staurois parvus TaxID=386267 RepID=A0ABN9C5I2_9NEOB|nr:unnamed protein product [Staurois parvus]
MLPPLAMKRTWGTKQPSGWSPHSSVYRVLRRPQEFLSRAPRQTLIFWGPPIKMLQNSKANLYHIIERASSAFPNVSAFVLSPRNMMRFDELFRGETDWTRPGKVSLLAEHRLVYNGDCGGAM